MRRLDCPADARFLAPLINREIIYRLMLGRDFDATSAGYRVGYDDASHFSREYKRLFGAPPMRDVERLRGAATQSAGL